MTRAMSWRPRDVLFAVRVAAPYASDQPPNGRRPLNIKVVCYAWQVHHVTPRESTKVPIPRSVPHRQPQRRRSTIGWLTGAVAAVGAAVIATAAKAPPPTRSRVRLHAARVRFAPREPEAGRQPPCRRMRRSSRGHGNTSGLSGEPKTANRCSCRASRPRARPSMPFADFDSP